MPNPASYVRPLVRELHPYVPGEQPKIKGLIKLNTNENPYPPSPKVMEAVRAAVDGRLRLYPNPAADALREALAKLHRCAPENIIVGNGSDEVLALSTRVFVEPAGSGKNESAETIQYFWPSYSLYPVLADTQGTRKNVVRLNEDFTIPDQRELRKRGWNNKAALTFITTPNAPGGRGYSVDQLRELCRQQRGVVILDEAYVDFAEENAMDLALELPNVLVARTFSKAYSLCFQRIGYFIGNPMLIEALHKVRDSYNVNGLGQVAALATLKDLGYYRANFKRIIASRRMTTETLTELGFEVLPSQTNFILARPPKFPAEEWLQKLRDRKILVRWFKDPIVSSYLRMTIGTEEEMRALISAAQAILK
jgi:histidinol-phosphate aminotransferase